jgi:hypothetical protein
MHRKHIFRTGFAGRRDARDYPLANVSIRFDEVATLMVLDNVLIPWEGILLPPHARGELHSCHPPPLFDLRRRVPCDQRLRRTG